MRRKFVDISQNYPTQTEEILKLISELFKIEKQASNFKELESLRQEVSQDILGQIRNWLIHTKASSIYRHQSHLEKAINYTLNHWEGLTEFIKNSKIPLTN